MEKILTIVIPCKNEEENIKQLFLELKQQNIGNTLIILADAKSTDKTRVLANTYAFELDLNLKIIDGGLPAVGRNAGAKLVKTPYILFLDADITFTDRQSIKTAFDSIHNRPIDMVGTTPWYKGEFDVRAWLLFRINLLITWYLSKTQPFAIGGFTLVKKDVFKKLGGYDEKATQSEDWLLSRQVKSSRFLLIPDLITQNNRRFKRYGYGKMIKLLLNNYKNRKNLNYFYKDVGYF
jgi:glycosyltransferase involved in cell wall biosynthesis